MNFKALSLVFIALIAILSTASASIPNPTHYVDGNPVNFGDSVTTNNPFEYKIVIANNDSFGKTFTVVERISDKLDLVSANMAYDTTTVGFYKKYSFSVFVPANGTATVIMNFKNNTGDDQSVASMNTSYYIGNDCVKEFELFVYLANVPAIPEFPSLLIPLAGVLGIAFVFFRRGL